MGISGWLHRSRCLAVAATATGAAVAMVRLLLEQRTPGSVTSADLALVEGCELGLVGCVAWAWLATIAVVAECWSGSAGRLVPGVPTAVRRVLLAACGVVVAGG